jgi:hypothetical protein
MPDQHHSCYRSVDVPNSRDDSRNDSRSANSEAAQLRLLDEMAKSSNQDAITAKQCADKSIGALEDLVAKQAYDIKEHQPKYEKLKAEFETLRGENLLLRKHLSAAKGRYKYVVRNAIEPYAELHGLNWNHHTAETMAMVVEPLYRDALETSELREQIATLQNEMFAKRDKVEVVSDNVFEQEFRNLAAMIKSTSRTVRPPQDVHITELTGSPGLLCGVNQKPWETRTRKKYLIEAWIWAVLCECVFANPFEWFGCEGSELAAVWARFFGIDEPDSWPPRSTLCETWRATTATHLSDLLELATVSEDSSKFGQSLLSADSDVHKYRNEVYHITKSFLTSISGVEDIPQVRSIIEKSFAFALQMSPRRTRVRITYPVVGSGWDGSSMKLLEDPDDDDDVTENGVVSFVLNPGLTKWGDAHGKKLDQRCDIVKAKIKLERLDQMEGVSLR